MVLLLGATTQHIFMYFFSTPARLSMIARLRPIKWSNENWGGRSSVGSYCAFCSHIGDEEGRNGCAELGKFTFQAASRPSWRVPAPSTLFQKAPSLKSPPVEAAFMAQRPPLGPMCGSIYQNNQTNEHETWQLSTIQQFVDVRGCWRCGCLEDSYNRLLIFKFFEGKSSK